jgi:hypothetical protein
MGAVIPTGDSRSRAAILIGLSLLLTCDLAFMVLHVVSRTIDWNQPWLRLDLEGSLAERFQHAKEAAIAAALGAIGWRTRSAVFAGWSLLFTYLLLDDGLQLHERGGRHLADSLGLPAALGLRPRDFGEIGVSLAAASVLFPLILVGYRIARDDHRAISRRLMVLLLFLVFFGIGVDMLHIAIDHLPVKGLSVLEDGGEMVAMTLILTYVAMTWVQLRKRTDPPGPLA